MHYDSKRVHQGPGSWLYPGMPAADLWGKVDGGSSPAGRVDTELGLTQQIPGMTQEQETGIQAIFIAFM